LGVAVLGSVGRSKPGREPVEDAEGKPFGDLDFPTADHLEVLVGGTTPVRVGREHFEKRGEGRPPKLHVAGEQLFMGKGVTTIDGIDLGTVEAVVRAPGGAIEALVVGGSSEAGFMAVPLGFVREVSAHIILEPSAEEVEAAQAHAASSPRMASALARARKGA
jgi:sporulation protein YlmC with PRC-barrel domain